MASNAQKKENLPANTTLTDEEAALFPIMAVAAGLLQEPEQTDDVNEFWEAHLDECKDLHQQAREVREASEEGLKRSEETLRMSQEAHQEAREAREMSNAYCERVETYGKGVDELREGVHELREGVHALAEEVHAYCERLDRDYVNAKAAADAAEERNRRASEMLALWRAEKKQRAAAARQRKLYAESMALLKQINGDRPPHRIKLASAALKKSIRRGKQYEPMSATQLRSRCLRRQRYLAAQKNGLLEILRRLLHALHLLIQRRRAANKPRTPGVEATQAPCKLGA